MNRLICWIAITSKFRRPCLSNCSGTSPLHGHAVTSYASQGKTVDHVLFSDSGVQAATNDQQWHVTISRGGRDVKIFTTDKARLREHVTRYGKEPLAMEVTGVKVPMAFIGNRCVPLNSSAYRKWRHKVNLYHEAVKKWLRRPSKNQSQTYDTLRTNDLYHK